MLLDLPIMEEDHEGMREAGVRRMSAYLQCLQLLPHHYFIDFVYLGSHILEVFLSGDIPI